jgi:hypothetical protein
MVLHHLSAAEFKYAGSPESCYNIIFIDLQMTNIVAGGPELQGRDASLGGQEGKEETYFEFYCDHQRIDGA